MASEDDEKVIKAAKLFPLVGMIVNAKRKSEGLDEIDEVQLYRKRIQKINAGKQTVGVVDEG
jgi:hypothetical protein